MSCQRICSKVPSNPNHSVILRSSQGGSAQSINIYRIIVLLYVFLECAKTLHMFHSPVKKASRGEDLNNLLCRLHKSLLMLLLCNFFLSLCQSKLKIGQTSLEDFKLQVIKELMHIIDEQVGIAYI